MLWYCHRTCDEVRESKRDEEIQGSEFIIIIYHRIRWIRREEEISVGEGE